MVIALKSKTAYFLSIIPICINMNLKVKKIEKEIPTVFPGIDHKYFDNRVV